MHILNQKSIKKTWGQAIAQPGVEFSRTKLKILLGNIPDGLRGTLYRNGPARLERGGIHVGHWFDGDGAILAINFTEAGASGVYRYVQTSGYQEEAKAGKLLYGNYGMTAPGAIWNQWRRPIKNVANTSVLALPDKLLALWEGDRPHALDLESLETRGIEDLGALDLGLGYSAHPKVDDKTKEIFNFGLSPGLNATLNLYKSDFTGKIRQKAKFSLEGLPLIHDFVLAGQYLVFFVSPIKVNNIWPVLFGTSTYGNSLKWCPEIGTEILVFNREDLSLVSRGFTEPWFQWHFANGYVDASGTVIVDIARYEDFQTNQYLKEVATGETHTLAEARLTRVHLLPDTGKVTAIQELVDRHCEFPGVPQQNVGQASRYTYMCTFRPESDISREILNAIARFDHHTEAFTAADLGENRYCSEPIHVQDRQNPNQSWLITVVYDGNSHSSEVWVFDCDRLDDTPVCKLGLPRVIPPGFHGTWKPQ
ncbi:carotenoid oxygenase [Calothrix brevissima NIES-22]|nr:carotenoid oxygenase [Calothrix brevissima NIES-22]